MIEVSRDECREMAERRYQMFWGAGHWTGADFGPELNMHRILMGVRGELAAYKWLTQSGYAAELIGDSLNTPDIVVKHGTYTIPIDVKAVSWNRNGSRFCRVAVAKRKHAAYMRNGWRMMVAFLGDWPKAWVTKPFRIESMVWEQRAGDGAGREYMAANLNQMDWCGKSFAEVCREAMA